MLAIAAGEEPASRQLCKCGPLIAPGFRSRFEIFQRPRRSHPGAATQCCIEVALATQHNACTKQQNIALSLPFPVFSLDLALHCRVGTCPSGRRHLRDATQETLVCLSGSSTGTITVLHVHNSCGNIWVGNSFKDSLSLSTLRITTDWNVLHKKSGLSAPDGRRCHDCHRNEMLNHPSPDIPDPASLAYGAMACGMAKQPPSAHSAGRMPGWLTRTSNGAVRE